MKIAKKRAIELRKKGMSYKEIAGVLKVSKSTLSLWLSKFKWSEDVKVELTEKNNKTSHTRLSEYNQKRKDEWERWREGARKEAKKEFKKFVGNRMFLAGIMLYWGECDSKMENGLVRLSNTDPGMIKIFSRFLRQVCKVSPMKIKVNMILYRDLKESVCKNFWSKAAEIPQEQFIKTQYIKGHHPSNRLEYGICSIYTCSRQLKEKINVWIKLAEQDICQH